MLSSLGLTPPLPDPAPSTMQLHLSKKAFLVELHHQWFVWRLHRKQSCVCQVNLDWTECCTCMGLVYISLLWSLVSSWLNGSNSLLQGFGGAGLCALACIWITIFLHLRDHILGATLLPFCKHNTYSQPVFHIVGLCLQSLVVHLLSILLFGGFWLVSVGILLPLMDVLWWNTGMNASVACHFAELLFYTLLHWLPTHRQ